MSDRRIRQQALDVGLTVGGQIAKRASDDRQQGHQSTQDRSHGLQIVAGRSRQWPRTAADGCTVVRPACKCCGRSIRDGEQPAARRHTCGHLAAAAERCARQDTGGRQRAEADDDTHQQRQRSRFGRDAQETADLRSGPFKYVRTPEVKRHCGELEGQSDRDHQASQPQHCQFLRTHRGQGGSTAARPRWEGARH